jgi:hypothetical protein
VVHVSSSRGRPSSGSIASGRVAEQRTQVVATRKKTKDRDKNQIETTTKSNTLDSKTMLEDRGEDLRKIMKLVS